MDEQNPEAGLTPDEPAAEPDTSQEAAAVEPAVEPASGVAEPIPAPATQADVDRLRGEVERLQAANDAGQPNDGPLASAQAELAAAESSLALQPVEPAPPLDPSIATTSSSSTSPPPWRPLAPPASVDVTVTVGGTTYSGTLESS